MTTPDAPTTLGQWLTQRQAELGGKWSDYAARVGISTQALRDIRNGQSSPRPETKHNIDVAFGWVPGHGVDRIRRGLAPINAEEDGRVAPPSDPERRAIYDALAPIPHEERMGQVEKVMAARYRGGQGTGS